MIKLVITDLDNTLYDWVTYFARSFGAMVAELAILLGRSPAELMDEFRVVNQTLGTVEQPYSVFALPAVTERYPDASPAELVRVLDPALHAFNSEREQTLRLYAGVSETFDWLRQRGVTIVGHTESSLANAYYRLIKLGIAGDLQRLYVLAGPPVHHPDPERLAELQPPRDVVVELPRDESKPNPKLLLDICARHGTRPENAIYVGDSLVRDVEMANRAGIRSAWAKYGMSYSAEDWRSIVRITHWSEADVAADEALRREAGSIKATYVLTSFSDLVAIVGAHKP